MAGILDGLTNLYQQAKSLVSSNPSELSANYSQLRTAPAPLVAPAPVLQAPVKVNPANMYGTRPGEVRLDANGDPIKGFQGVRRK